MTLHWNLSVVLYDEETYIKCYVYRVELWANRRSGDMNRRP